MALHISPKQLEIYKRTALTRMQAEKELCAKRRAQAWALARQAANILRSEYGVSRLVVFGSLAHEGRFTLYSDVDLAAWGLTSANWLRAMSAVHAISSDIEINLVDITICSPELLATIEKEGYPI
jgi:predicted nucleotidyltransferase